MENNKKNLNLNHQHQGQHATSKYCMIVHEISIASTTVGEVVGSCLASKWYLFCDQIPGHDAFVTKEILNHFEGPAVFLRG